MNKPTLMIDIDDVLALDGFINALNAFDNKNYKYSDCKSYYLQELVSDKDAFFKFLIEQDLNWYKFGRVNTKLIKVLEAVSEYYEIFPFSAYIIPELKEESARSLVYKHAFLRKFLPFIDPNNYMFGSRKDLFYFDVKIDDKIRNIKNAGKKLLYTAYHNETIPNEMLESRGIIRVDDADDIEYILLKDIRKQKIKKRLEK